MMSSKSQAASRAKVTIERVYEADIEDVWDLWTTKQGFESWWGPQGFRADVHELEARTGGVLRYDMVADTDEMVAAMKQVGRPPSHGARATFAELAPRSRLVLRSVIDFLPGVEAYESDIAVDFTVLGSRVKMVVALEGMHSDELSKMQLEGFTSQLTKLDARFG
jgi:uncharacterized protein YndB with AHSA1/START domain